MSLLVVILDKQEAIVMEFFLGWGRIISSVVALYTRHQLSFERSRVKHLKKETQELTVQEKSFILTISVLCVC